MSNKHIDECIRHLFRLKQANHVEALTKMLHHYAGLDEYLEHDKVPEVELAKILSNQSSLTLLDLQYYVDELFVRDVRVCSNEFKHAWNPYECTFSEFRSQHKYIRVWDEPNPSHRPEMLFLTYAEFV